MANENPNDRLGKLIKTFKRTRPIYAPTRNTYKY